MKKIFSVLVVAFFLAATFVLVPQSNYLAFAEEDSDIEEVQTEKEVEIESHFMERLGARCSSTSGCSVGNCEQCINGRCVTACENSCYRCVSGRCTPRCTNRQKCILSTNDGVQCAAQCPTSKRCPHPECFTCVDNFCQLNTCPPGESCILGKGCTR